MHRSIRLLAACGLLLIPTLVWADAKDDAKAELKKFAGTWKVVSAESGGVKVPDEKREKMSITFDGDKITLKGFHSEDTTTPFKIDPSKKPATIDFVPPEGGKDRSLGIYKFEDGKLTICASDNDKQARPTEFKAEGKVVLMVLEKEKK